MVIPPGILDQDFLFFIELIYIKVYTGVVNPFSVEDSISLYIKNSKN